MPIPAFDTYKAVQSLKEAGFEEAQATAVVAMVGAATGEDLAALREDIAALPTKDDVKKTIADALKPYATKEDLKPYATKEDLKPYATKEDLKPYATKDHLDAALAGLEVRIVKYLVTTVLATAGIVITVLKWL